MTTNTATAAYDSAPTVNTPHGEGKLLFWCPNYAVVIYADGSERVLPVKNVTAA